jgi:molecular chaperone DnaK
LADLKKALEGEDIDAIRTATEKVATTSQSLGAAMYAQTQAEAGAGASEAGAGSADDHDHDSTNDDEIVDAEIVDDGETT